MYAKRLYGAKNTVQVLTEMQQQNTKACLLKHAFSINNKKCSGEMYAKYLGKMYAKRLYGAKNAVQKC